MTSSNEYTAIYNPYDFSNPVSNRFLFIGREPDLNDVRYYLKQATKAPRPTSIALLGPRAAGKTSFLNIIELEAKDLSFCVARIDLNEGDIQNELSFFFKLFDGILSSTCNYVKNDGNNCFGGKDGDLYQEYLDMVSIYEIPIAKKCPFIFPKQYAKAMSKGVVNCKLSDANYKIDLEAISKEVKVPVLILFDECNVLAGSRILLEMLRNIFMNLPGFMLVLTGTPDLFPIMDEVFSPIVRQFKKIEVDNFKDQGEVDECIKRPLESVGLTDTSAIVMTHTIYEIFELTNGRAYEIQLLCHFMFKRMQDGRSKNMELNLSVLDDVLKELSRGHSLTDKPIINGIRCLDEKHLNALKLLSSCSGRASFDQLWFVEYLIMAEHKWTRAELNSCYQLLLENKILVEDNGVIYFSGDEFDKIYSKYFAIQSKVDISSFNFDLDGLLNSRLSGLFIRHCNVKPFNHLFSSISADYRKTCLTNYHTVFDIIDSVKSVNVDICNKYQSLLRAIIQIMSELLIDGNKFIRIHNVTVESLWGKSHHPFYDNIENKNKAREIALLIDKHAKKFGGNVEYIEKTLDIVTTTEIITIVKNMNNPEFTKLIISTLFSNMLTTYFEKKDAHKAVLHGEIALEISDELSPVQYNNLGYIYLTIHSEKAENCLLKAQLKYTNTKESTITCYNLGIFYGLFSNYKLALEYFQKTIDILMADGNSETHCLLKLYKGDTGLETTEFFTENLMNASTQMIGLLNQAGLN